MNPLLRRLDELLHPSRPEAGAAAERLGLDLMVTAVGLAAFGMVLPPGAELAFRVVVGLKFAAIFLLAFVVILAPLYAIQRFFEVEVPFGKIVGALARHLALGGVFATAMAGVFGLVRRGEATFDGTLALVLFAGLIAAVLACRQRGTSWLPKAPAALALTLFLAILGQGAWAFRPYLDPSGPTLFAAQAEWFTGSDRQGLERLVRRIGTKP